MRKLALAVLLTLCLTGCTKAEPETIYVAHGYYYASGEIVTNDGNIWGYISEAIAYDCEVYVVFRNNGTEPIYDDIIIDVIQGGCVQCQDPT